MSGSDPSYGVILVTAGDEKGAVKIARTLVEERLAACVNVVPGLRSVYRWEGAVEEAEEVLLVIKTRSERFEAVRRRVVSLHAYDLPEVVALPVVEGHAPYLEWIRHETGG